MRCGVLGALTVTRGDGRSIQVTSEKQRTLLAILLSRPGQSLSADRLVDLLWPVDPPASARPNVQVYVHRLRRLLGADVIVHDDVGYRLAVEPDDIDAIRFGALARAAEEQLATGDLEAARATFDDALSLWRGAPYSGTSTIEALRVEADRLTEVHLGVLGGRYEALIRLGLAAQVVSDLRAAIADHPWHERFRGQLMRALYAIGRGPDALAAFREARDLFVEELGIEPGPEMRRIEHAILTDDIAALEIGERPAAQASPVPLAPTAGAAARPPTAVGARVAPLSGQAAATVPETPMPGSTASAASRSGELADRHADRPTVRPILVPAELPAPDPAFSGRATLVDDIAGRLTSGPGRIVILHGRGGTGKSTLALRVAQHVTRHYPDGQLYVGMHGATPGREPLSARAAVARCLRSLGFADREIPDDIDEAAAQLRSALANRRLLLVLDDVRDAAQVRPMLPGATGRSSVVVTSRRAMPTVGTDHISVGVLDNADAIELLARVVGSDRVAAEPEAAADIVDLCGRLALAVRIAAARLVARTDWTLSTMATRLADERHRLDELESDDLTVRSSCAISVDTLDEDAAHLFQYLGVLDLATISPHAAAALVRRTVPAAERLLDALVDVHLADPSGGPRRVLHDLVRLYARDLAHERLSADERQAAIVRVGHHYVLAARTACQVYGPVPRRRLEAGVASADVFGTAPTIPDGVALRHWVRHEAANVSAVGWHLASLGSIGSPLLVALGSAVVEPFGSLGLWTDAMTVNETALAAAEEAGDAAALALVHDNLGHIDAQVNRLPAATRHYEAALRYSRLTGDRGGEVSAQHGLGLAAVRSGRTEDARRHHSTALDLARALHDPWGESMACNGLGMVLTAEGRCDEAVTMYERALEIDAAAHEGRWHGVVVFNLGTAHRAAGRTLEAISAFERCADLSRSRGHALALARALWVLADIMREVDDDAEADARRKEALEVLRELDLVSDPEIDDIVAQSRPAPPGVLTVG